MTNPTQKTKKDLITYIINKSIIKLLALKENFTSGNQELNTSERSLLEFAKNYPTWHSFEIRDDETREAVKSLKRKNLIITNGNNKFKIK